MAPWLASAYFIVLFFFSLFDPGNSLKFMMGATVRSLAIIGIAAFVSGMFSRWLAKTITLSPHTQRNYPELQKRLNGWLSAALKTARILTVCVAVMLLLSAWGLFDFWNWLQNGAGQKTVDILIRIALILFLLGGWLDGARQFDRKPAGFGYSWPPATQRPHAYPAYAVS